MTSSETIIGELKRYAAIFKTQVAPAPTILVVDDEAAVRAFVARVLRNAGYSVETAACGQDALDALDGGVYQLVITDVRMPGMSGPRFISLLRRRHTDVKVLYLTGYNDQLFAERELLWDGEAFLDKPCTVKALIESVSLLLFEQIKTLHR